MGQDDAQRHVWRHYLGSLKNPTFQFTPGTFSEGTIASVLLAKDATGVVTSGGSGYIHAPNVTIAPPANPSGKAATAVATMKIDKITVPANRVGKGYITAPLVTFAGGGGNGAMANAFLRVDTDPSLFSITAGGVGYPANSQLRVSFTPSPAGAAATAAGYATTNAAGQVNGIVVTKAGSGYSTIPLVTVLSRDYALGTTVKGSGAKASVTGVVDAIVLYGTDHTTPAMNALTSGGGGYTDLSAGNFFVTLTGGLKLDAKTGAPVPGAVAAAGVATGKVSDVTLTHPGSGYVSTDVLTVSITPVAGDPAAAPDATATASLAAVSGSKASYHVKTKTIQELFDPTYGRLNATLGVELPFTAR